MVNYNSKEMRKEACQNQHRYITLLFDTVIPDMKREPETWGDLRTFMNIKYAGHPTLGKMIHFFDSVLEIKEDQKWSFVYPFLHSWREACFKEIRKSKSK